MMPIKRSPDEAKTEATPPKMEGLAVGDPAPAFTLPDETGAPVSLSQFAGKRVVLYFYPKDDTPGCTKEACAFRDGRSQLARRNAVVLGVSADSVESHRKFKQKYGLTFPLLSDADRKVCAAYGVWKQKSLYGRLFMGISRATFIIGPDGRIEKAFPTVKVDGHLEAVLGEL
jgi:peroxiredoxin Q/BCP